MIRKGEIDSFEQKVEKIITEDPVNRGTKILKRYTHGDLKNATDAILAADTVFVATGCYIPAAHTIETDGLSGALFLTRALLQLGKRATLINDPQGGEIIPTGMTSLGIDRKKHLQDFRSVSFPVAYSNKKVVFIAVEVLGKNKSGRYKSMKGIPVPEYPFDDLLYNLASSSPSIISISCADGINDVGMKRIPRNTPLEKDADDIHSDIAVDYLVVAGVADWAAFGLITTLSKRSKQDLLPSSLDQEQLLTAVVNAGAVDGITTRRELTVDTLPLARHQQKVHTLRQLLESEESISRDTGSEKTRTF